MKSITRTKLVECNICQRKFKNQTVLKLHLKACEKSNQYTKQCDDQTLLKTQISSEMQLPPKPPDPSLCKNHYKWGNYDSKIMLILFMKRLYTGGRNFFVTIHTGKRLSMKQQDY